MGAASSQSMLFQLLVLSCCLLLFMSQSCAESAGDDDDEDDSIVIDLSPFGSRLYGMPQKSAGDSVRAWQRSRKHPDSDVVHVNPEELGPYAEGDMLIPRKAPNARNGMAAESYRWRDAIVPFEIVGSFDAREMGLIENAIVAYHENTCIKFVPRTRADPDYITIQNANSGCWSSVGRIGGRQVVNLQTPGCTTKVGTVMHELTHAIGFLHEQNREERDDFVDIRLENVRKGYEVNFERAAKDSTSGFGVGYDYKSVMHYSEGAFSSNGQPTIVTKHHENIGQRDGFSQSDIRKIQSMYKCTQTTASSGYKPSIAITQPLMSGGIADIWNMIVPTDVTQKKNR